MPRFPKPPAVSFATLDALLAHQFAGNAYSDGPAFTAVEEFVRHRASGPAEARAALQHMSTAGMGADDLITDADVAEWLANA